MGLPGREKGTLGRNVSLFTRKDVREKMDKITGLEGIAR